MMDELKKAKLGEIISRTDKTGNEKLEMLVEFSQWYARQVAEQAAGGLHKEGYIPRAGANRILSRINQLTEQ